MIPASYQHTPVNQVYMGKRLATASTDVADSSATIQLSLTDSTVLFPHTLTESFPIPSAISVEKNKIDLTKIMALFPKIFDGQCRPMAGPPCHFELREGYTTSNSRITSGVGTTDVKIEGGIRSSSIAWYHSKSGITNSMGLPHRHRTEVKLRTPAMC